MGIVPDLESAADELAGTLVAIDPRGHLDVVLHWQQWRLRSASLDSVAGAVLDAAREHLGPAQRGRPGAPVRRPEPPQA